MNSFSAKDLLLFSYLPIGQLMKELVVMIEIIDKNKIYEEKVYTDQDYQQVLFDVGLIMISLDQLGEVELNMEAFECAGFKFS